MKNTKCHKITKIICVSRKATKNYNMAINKMSKVQHGCVKIQ